MPSIITELLKPRGLAYWIMDDGSKQNKGLHLNTYGFTYEDVLILKTTLQNLFSTHISASPPSVRKEKGDR